MRDMLIKYRAPFFTLNASLFMSDINRYFLYLLINFTILNVDITLC